MKQKILVTRTIPEAGMKLLNKIRNTEVTVWHDSRDAYGGGPAIPRKTLLRMVRGTSAVLCMLTEIIDEELFTAAGPQLKIVANNAVGFNNIDLTAAKGRGIVITNTPGVLNRAVAEHTIALIMAAAKRIIEADRYTRAGKFKTWAPLLMLTTELFGKTLGLVGSGRIGSMVGAFANKGLGMRVIYHDIVRSPALERETGAKRVGLMALLKRADVVSLHVPLLPSTRYLIDTPQFAVMKKTALLINTARGPVVREKALLRALTKKRIAAAALDVFECEPLIDCDITDHLALRKLDNIILTPHIASSAREARDEMARTASANIAAVLAGKKPLTPVR